MDIWISDFIQFASDRPVLTATFLSLILASDILLPIPANETNVAAGFILGFYWGFLVGLIGRSLSCIIGYWIGIKFARPVTRRFVSDKELKRLEKLYDRFGDWVVIILRTVPVLAEVSVLFAGMSKMPAFRFYLYTTLTNFCVSIVFSFVGAWSATFNSILLALGISVLIPLTIMLILRSKKIPYNSRQ